MSQTEAAPQPIAKPSWLKVRLPSHRNFFAVSQLLEKKGLHTICQSAHCPNITECWSHKTATFLILGDVCTRGCAFCSVKKGIPEKAEIEEADMVAEAVRQLGLRYCVITSVTRDDLPDGGSTVFAAVIKKLRAMDPELLIELLIPDFQGDMGSLNTVLAQNPDVLNHNIEAPRSIYPAINRVPANYSRSLELLRAARKKGFTTKSGLMVGLGETGEEISKTFADLRNTGCSLLTIGQYLQPSKKNIPVRRYYSPSEFQELKREALNCGFSEVESGPLVRSSYMAHRMYNNLGG